MVAPEQVKETVLVVDDEDSVRRTIRDWLINSNLDVEVLAASDSETALTLANENVIDLAILDWNLGAGLNGLELLQDLAEFHEHIIAIMITAFADQATPLDAMRCGVRDYLDKNHELTRETFLKAVQRQIDYIRPAKRERFVHNSLVHFRNSVDRILPLVQSISALNDPVTLPEVIGSFFRFLQTITHASDGVLFVRYYNPEKHPPEVCRVYGSDGSILDVPLVPYANTIVASAASMQEPCEMHDLSASASKSNVTLQQFEQNRFSLLAAPLAVGSGIHVVLELFDKRSETGEIDPNGFSSADIRIVRDAGEFGAEMLRQFLSEKQTHQLLLEAVQAARKTSETVSSQMHAPGAALDVEEPEEVLDHIRHGLHSTGASADSEGSLRVAEAIRQLAVDHGPEALQYCQDLILRLHKFLNNVTGQSL